MKLWNSFHIFMISWNVCGDCEEFIFMNRNRRQETKIFQEQESSLDVHS